MKKTLAGDVGSLTSKVKRKVIRKVEGLEVFAPAVATSIPSGPTRRGDILDIFLAYKMAAPWEVRTQFALNSDHFPVIAKIGGDPLKARISSRTDWAKFKKLSGKLGLNRVPINIETVTEEAVKFTRDVQKVLDECTRRVPLGRRNDLGLSKVEKEIIGRKNRVKQDWNFFKRGSDRSRLRTLEREVRDVLVEARQRKMF